MTKTTPSKATLDIRKPYETTMRLRKHFSKPTMAKQSFQQECDINTIMDKYKKTGVLQHVKNVQGAYGDFSNVVGYQLALDQVIAAQEAFDELPAKLRARFGNDPAQLMVFLEDPNNQDEAVKLGLANPVPAKPDQEPEKKSTGAPPQTPPATPPKGEAPA